MKNVLIIVDRFPATGGSRIDKVVKYLPSCGWNPIVLTTKWTDDSKQTILLRKEFPDNVRVLRAFSLVKTPFRILSRYFGLPEIAALLERILFIPDPSVTWLLHAVIKGLPVLKDESVKLVLSSSPPESAHLIGFALSRLTKKKWIADFRDLWTKYNARYKPPTLMHDKITKGLERFILHEADHIIANTETNRDLYTKDFSIPKKKMSIITNGYDPVDRHKVMNFQSSVEKTKFKIGYMGYFDKPFFPWRGFLLAFEKLIKSTEANKIIFNIYGYVSREAINWVDTHNLRNHISFHGQFRHSKAIQLAAQNDLLLLLLHDDESSKAIVPLKLYSYLIMNKPLLAVAPRVGECSRIIEKTKIGSIVPPNNNEQIFKVLLNYYEKWLDNKKVPFNSKLDEIEKYDAKILTERLSETFDKLLNT